MHSRDLAPEHTQRGSVDHDSGGELHPELVAAYDYVDSVLHTADVTMPYVWHGWALREAFLAGISYAKREGEMIQILETKMTAKMDLSEAKVLHKLLGSLPRKRNDAAIKATEFTPQQWERLIAIYDALDFWAVPIQCRVRGQ